MCEKCEGTEKSREIQAKLTDFIKGLMDEDQAENGGVNFYEYAKPVADTVVALTHKLDKNENPIELMEGLVQISTVGATVIEAIEGLSDKIPDLKTSNVIAGIATAAAQLIGHVLTDSEKDEEEQTPAEAPALSNFLSQLGDNA